MSKRSYHGATSHSSKVRNVSLNPKYVFSIAGPSAASRRIQSSRSDQSARNPAGWPTWLWQDVISKGIQTNIHDTVSLNNLLHVVYINLLHVVYIKLVVCYVKIVMIA